jgi:hypothetical protein
MRCQENTNHAYESLGGWCANAPPPAFFFSKFPCGKADHLTNPGQSRDRHKEGRLQQQERFRRTFEYADYTNAGMVGPITKSPVRKHATFCAIYRYKRTFYQDRLGTNTGKTPKMSGVFLRRLESSLILSIRTPTSLPSKGQSLPGRVRTLRRCDREKTAFLSHLYIKMNILPRQARDRHRESTQKRDAVFSGAEARRGWWQR